MLCCFVHQGVGPGFFGGSSGLAASSMLGGTGFGGSNPLGANPLGAPMFQAPIGTSLSNTTGNYICNLLYLLYTFLFMFAFARST